MSSRFETNQRKFGLVFFHFIFPHTEDIIKFWNTLPQDIAEAKSVLGFKLIFDTFGMESSSGGCETAQEQPGTCADARKQEKEHITCALFLILPQ